MKHGKLLCAIRDHLRPRYSQIPALSTTKGEYFQRYYLSHKSAMQAVSDSACA